jgi:phosphatidylglycerophosphate synthase
LGARIVYQKTRKVPDLFWNMYVCRPVAAVLVDLLKDTRVTPNQITLAAVVVAVASAVLLLILPGHQGLVVAIVVYQVSYVLDCADGMLARWRGVQSTPGHLLDFLMDEIKAFVVLGAVAVRLYYDRGHDALFLMLGIGGLVALASGIALTTFQRRPEIVGSAAEKSAAPVSLIKRAVRAIEGVAKFLIHYPSYILYAAIAGRIEYYFYPYIAVNGVYALRAFAGVAMRFGRQ